MKYKTWIRLAGLACLIGLLSLAPASRSLAAAAWTKSGGVYIGSDGTAIAGVVARGVDVSHWNQSINWNAVAADDIQFAMIGTRYNNAADPNFAVNAQGAAAAGLRVGAYLYSYATTVEAAKAEAAFVLNLIKDYPISYPVVFDVEAPELNSLSPSALADIINAFCQEVRSAGYYPMVYANDYWLAEKIDMSKVRYDVWVARHDARPSYENPAMWQATSRGQVSGISGDVDINFAYKDFHSLILPDQWRQIGGNWYYYDDYRKQTGWINDGNGWYYMKEDGTQHKGWIHIGNVYYYLDNSTGRMVTGWLQDNGRWYYFNASGEMATGWIQDSGSYYYLADDGAMATGWLKSGESTYYYLKSDGAMATGWYMVDGVWYYFNPNGEMLRGWTDVGGARYFLGTDGAMATGWQLLDNVWYYFGSDGAMRTGWIQLDNAWYYLNADGQMLTGWQLIDGEYYYLHDGKMLIGWVNDSTGSTYFMDRESGKMARAWKEIDGSWYYFNQYGQMQKGWLNLSGKYYYLDPQTGKMAANGSRTIDNVTYTFDRDGVCQNETSNMSGLSDSYFNPETVRNTLAGQSASQTSSQTSSTVPRPGTGLSGSAGSSQSAPGSAGSSQSAPSSAAQSASGAPTGQTSVLVPPISGSSSGSVPAASTGSQSSGSLSSGQSGTSASDAPGSSGYPESASGNSGSSGSAGRDNIPAGQTDGPPR